MEVPTIVSGARWRAEGLRHFALHSEPAAPAPMRQCPTLAGDERPLIAHTIVNGVCMEQQRAFYHKCHRCIFSGKPADFVFEPESRNGTTKPTAVPREATESAS